ncbi:MAG: hypothetical protein SGILL_002560 [Bacillariaceae sp.]
MVVEMSSFKLPHLPPSIQRFRCGGDGQEADVQQDVGHSQDSRRRTSYTSSARTGGAASSSANGTERVRAFVHGMVSPFTACLQPSVTSCVAGGASCVSGCGPDYSTVFHKKPAVVVSPLVDRQTATYRDSRSSPMTEDESSVVASRYHPSTSSKLRPSPPRIGVDPAQAAAMRSRSSHLTSTDIEKPHHNDILCGRGGSSNRHLGNIHFRELVAANKKVYVGLTKKQKMMMARSIVDTVKGTDPSGRFLAKDSDTGLYYDIGLPRSLEKTSQALREKNSNEMPKEQQEEGIEASVESFKSIVTQGKGDTTETQQNAGESPESSTSPKPPRKSTKDIKAPPLVIPSHLKAVFEPKPERSERDAAEYSMSPNGTPYMDHQYGPPSPYHAAYGHGVPPPPHGGYSVGHHAPRPPAGHPAYPPSSPPGPYDRYYYHSHHQRSPRSPPYGQYPPHPAEEHRHHYYRQPQDHRESYSEYYSRSADRESPHRADGHGRPPPPPTRYSGHGYPPAHPLAQPPGFHGRSSAPPPPPPPHPHDMDPTSPPSYRPSAYGHPSAYHHPGAPSPHDRSPRIIYRTPSNGYVRGTTDISPERQREVKRQRNADGHVRRVSESSLSSEVRNRLSLNERGVGRERHSSVASSTASSSNSTGTSSSDLMSPSSILQSRSRRSMDGKDKRASLASEEQKDYSSLSGLAALSTAAFLKLDEDD